MPTKMMRLGAAALLFALLAFTPFGYAAAPQESFVNIQPKIPTYSVTYAGLTPAATATDVIVLTGSATKTVHLVEFKCSGTTTAAASSLVLLIARSTADTGGTAVTTQPIFGHHATAAANATADPAATATVTAYSANPTLGTSAGILDSGLLLTPAPASIGASNGIDFLYNYNQTSETREIPDMFGVANQIAFSFNGGTIPSGLTNLTCTVVWTEN
jgi:hypothetical protein